MHPTDELRGAASTLLEGRTIVLGVTGSIAAVECVKLARMLIRHGAAVHAVMTAEARKIVGEYALGFATANQVITELTGDLEHVAMCGDVEGRADLLLIAPCTANTLGKIVNAIDDTPVTTFATTAIGTGIPLIVVPAMHNTMYAHEGVASNIKKARSMGIEVVDPVLSEKKAKMAPVDTIVEIAIRKLSGGGLQGRKVLIVAGANREEVDDMRLLTNRATGRTGIHLAMEAFRRGADVTLLAGVSVHGIPPHFRTVRFGGVMDLWEKVEEELSSCDQFDIALFPAGISDYIPSRLDGKVPSGREEMTLELKPAIRIMDRFVKRGGSRLIVGFKAESVSGEELLRRAYRRLKEVGMDLIVANDLSQVKEDSNHVMIISNDREVLDIEGSKADIASVLMARCQEMLVGIKES
ncbi:MAG: bifunctional phosphopantothenoylcysteine decarboxylase/phosphopantothenate--cysteine ligase CoaBC [Candidatus Thermoplasmatota archaeon]|nr:bifunctional phosphopantothenoylcysteine decarboxylase/phosphopantothenate--cysteine ligase CoaBC [Candidatus Thermoplasmatota archaeon]